MGGRPGRVTIDEVAREAGVSKATVSVVLNGRGRALGIREATQAVVLATSERLGYHPHQAARDLRRRRTNVLTLLVQDLANPCFVDIAVAAGRAAEECGYEVKVVNAGPAAAEMQALDRLAGDGSDGVIVATGRHHRRPEALAALRHLVRRGLPAVMLLDRSPDPAIPAVRVDVEAGAYAATRYLIGLGHRRVAHLALAGEPAIAAEQTSQGDRYRGYRRALAEANIAPDPAWLVRGQDGLDGGRTMMRDLLDRGGVRPTAALIYNDLTAVGALSALAERGVDVPRDMAVVGTDDIDLAAFTCPPLTTVEHPRAELGRLGVGLLLELLAGDRAAVPEVVLPARLVVRQSCGATATATATA